MNWPSASKDGYKSLKTDDFDYTWGFPAKFLITPNEEIIETIKQQYARTLEKRKADETRQLVKKTNKQTLAQQALSKLTDEEKAALNLTGRK